MKRKKLVEVRISGESNRLLKMASKRSGLTPKKVLNLILECEINIAWHVMARRRKLYKRLKIKPTVEQLFGI